MKSCLAPVEPFQDTFKYRRTELTRFLRRERRTRSARKHVVSTQKVSTMGAKPAVFAEGLRAEGQGSGFLEIHTIGEKICEDLRGLR